MKTLALITAVVALSFTGCVSLNLDTKYGHLGIGTDGKRVQLGWQAALGK